MTVNIRYLSFRFLVFLDRYDQWSDIVSSGVVVLLVRSVTERKGSREPAAAKDFFPGSHFIHGSDLGRLQINLLEKKSTVRFNS